MKLLVYGSKEFGEVIAGLVPQCGHEFMGYIDDFSEGEQILGPYEQVRQEYPPAEFGMVIAIGYRWLAERRKLLSRLQDDGYVVHSLVHPTAHVAPTARVGTGAFVMAGAIVDSHASVGELAVCWPRVVVNHHSTVGSNTFLSPGVIICGGTQVGSHCFVGAGSIIANHLVVPDGSFIRAGEVVGPNSTFRPYAPERQYVTPHAPR